MDKIAIISDVHGNIPALRATFADIRQRGIETIYCLGNLVGKGPQSDVAVDLCREWCDVVVGGNWSDYICWKMGDATLAWHRERLGRERLNYLGSLPRVVDFWMSGKRVRLFHASHESVYTRVRHDAPASTHLQMFANTDFTGFDEPKPDVVGYGDIHLAFSVGLPEGKTLFNTGSVGNPLDQPLASYAILEGRFGSEEAALFGIQTVRLPYDIEEAVAVAAGLGMPELEPYAAELRTAVYRGRQ